MKSLISLIAVLLPTGSSRVSSIETEILVQSEEFDFADALIKVLKPDQDALRRIATGNAGQEIHPSKILEISVGENDINGVTMKEEYRDKILDIQAHVETLLSTNPDLHITLSTNHTGLFTSN
mgnify:CR=1 FL=1